MSEQPEVGRRRWDDQLDGASQQASLPVSQPGGGPTGKQVIGLVLFLIIVIAVFLLTGRSSAEIKASGPTGNATYDRWLATLLALGVGTLVYGFALVSGATRRGRIIRVVSSFWAGGLLLAIGAYMIMGMLMPSSGFQERLIIPGLLLMLFFVLGLFSPAMRLWPLNVPDGETWMILDVGDHIMAYIGAGLRWVRPIDGFERYDQGGALVIEVDDEDFYTLDNFPFRVRAKVVCLFNPMRAEERMWVALRSLSRATLQTSLHDEVVYIINNELLGDLRQNIREPGNFRIVLNRIYRDIREAVENRANLGVHLAPNNPINVTLLPTKMVSASSERLIALEAAAGGGRLDDQLQMLGQGPLDNRLLSDIVRLAARDGDLSIRFDAQGNVQFVLASGDEVDIGDSLSETLIRAAGLVAQVAARQHTPPQVDSLSPMAQPHELPAGSDWEEMTQRTEPVTGGSTKPAEAAPSQKVEAPQNLPDDIIDTEADTDGIFRPRRNPIIPEELPDDL